MPSRGDMDSVVVVDNLDRKNAMAVLRKMIREAPDLLRKMVCAWLDFRVVAVYRTCMHFTGTFEWIKVHKLIKADRFLLESNRDKSTSKEQTQKYIERFRELRS